jgi:hypothetical protein
MLYSSLTSYTLARLRRPIWYDPLLDSQSGSGVSVVVQGPLCAPDLLRTKDFGGHRPLLQQFPEGSPPQEGIFIECGAT